MYPIGLRLDGRPCLVAGGGQVAARKVRSLLEAGAAVTLVAPEVVPPLAALAAEGRIRWLVRQAEAEIFAQLEARPLLVFCATDDAAVNEAFGRAAGQAGALVNDAAAPELCDFFVPAAIREGELLVTVSTGGASPALARVLKRRIAAFLGHGWGEWIARLLRLRQRAKERLADSRTREAFWRGALSDRVLDLVEDGEIDKAEAEVKNEIDRFGTQS